MVKIYGSVVMSEAHISCVWHLNLHIKRCIHFVWFITQEKYFLFLIVKQVLIQSHFLWELMMDEITVDEGDNFC
jgi:hypothetical protein